MNLWQLIFKLFCIGVGHGCIKRTVWGSVGPRWHYAGSRARGIYPEGRGWLGGAAVLAFVHAPFHQLAGQERQTEKSNSIPAQSLQLLHLHSGAGRTSQNVESTATSTLSHLHMLCKMVQL